MKGLVRNIVLYSGSLFILPNIVGGVHISGGIWTYLFGGLMLTFMMAVIKPILNVISFPFNLVTLGFFSIFTNAFILYLLTVFVSGIIIRPYRFDGLSFLGFAVPGFMFNTLFAFLAAAVVLAAIVMLIKWIIE